MSSYHSWDVVQRELLTEDEIAKSDQRARDMLNHLRDSGTATTMTKPEGDDEPSGV